MVGIRTSEMLLGIDSGFTSSRNKVILLRYQVFPHSSDVNLENVLNDPNRPESDNLGRAAVREPFLPK